MREGWTCPKCGRGVRPDVETCDHGGSLAQSVEDIARIFARRPGDQTPCDPLEYLRWSPTAVPPATSLTGTAVCPNLEAMLWN